MGTAHVGLIFQNVISQSVKLYRCRECFWGKHVNDPLVSGRLESGAASCWREVIFL